jgi:hypothetical protein
MFEIASRKKIRFDIPRGQVTVEDLWDLPLTSLRNPNLDDIARNLHKQLNNGENVSFVHGTNMSDSQIQFKFDLVRHIIDTRLEENKLRSEEQNRATKKQALLAIMAERQADDIRNLPTEELQKMINDLG